MRIRPLVAMDEQPFLRRLQVAGNPEAQTMKSPGQDGRDDARAAGQRARRLLGAGRPAGASRPGAAGWWTRIPLNILRLPVIRRHVPECTHHPCGAPSLRRGFRCQNFLPSILAAPEFALLCADLPTLAAAYARMFDFWYREQAVLQAAVHELRYETLVADFEGEVRTHQRLPAAATGRTHAVAGGTMHGPRSIHQHPQLLPGGAAGQPQIGGTLATLPCHHFEPVLPVAGAVSANDGTTRPEGLRVRRTDGAAHGA